MSKRKQTDPEPELTGRCAGVLDGRNIAALNTTLRSRGVSDNDRHEILKFAASLGAAPTKAGEP